MSKREIEKTIKIPIPIMGILGFVFIYLKANAIVTWSWLWVLAPFWLPFAIGLAFLGTFFIIAVLGAVIAAFANSRKF